MRVITGNYGGRRLKAVPGMKTRPTTDKVKESMFNIIGPYFDGGKVLDLFSGSGGLSIEAVSRGAEEAYLIDRQFQAIKTIKENIAITKEENKFHIFKADAHKILKKFSQEKLKFDYVFLDPPYAQQKIILDLEEMVKLDLLNDSALIVCETDQNAKLPTKLNNFKCIKQVTYGITVLTFYQFEVD
ncbi:16S rRNA (guanine(966)-N(2))-methyltransferase RsmD [Ligilactobacillus cholophilus]|uniref:16S rRNA (guanine(966)-N(2))-methyltransferase RsmD n=1 Tax=Ligilactobacillus cholophilus TaxID=3050131 RepID=UPI0025B17A5C|nr:16S rRNA (guanine(966)-N(2))-methyltransferase RsmD [Ligilactobacillus cholophilus]